MYVPLSPFNTITLQMLIANLNTKDNLDVEYEIHDYIEYIIIFKISIRDYPSTQSPYQSGVMVTFAYVPLQAILPSVEYPVPSNVMNVMMVLT